MGFGSWLLAVLVMHEAVQAYLYRASVERIGNKFRAALDEQRSFTVMLVTQFTDASPEEVEQVATNANA